MKGVVGSEKHVVNFYIFIWRKAVNLNGLRANRYELMEMYLFVHRPYRALNSDRYLATLFCVQEKF
jgi:hypothetical protein